MKFTIPQFLSLLIAFFAALTALIILTYPEKEESMDIMVQVLDTENIELFYAEQPPATPHPAVYTPIQRVSAEELDELLQSVKINLNTANAEELTGLPGVGPASAERILAFRNTHGPFKSVRDLSKVKGFGTKTVARIAPYLTVGHKEDLDSLETPKTTSTSHRKSSTASRTPQNPPAKRININTAGIEELTKLPRVGPATARQIIEYRELHGNFQNPEDIQKVKRIGPKTYENMKEWITVSKQEEDADE